MPTLNTGQNIVFCPKKAEKRKKKLKIMAKYGKRFLSVHPDAGLLFYSQKKNTFSQVKCILSTT